MAGIANGATHNDAGHSREAHLPVQIDVQHDSEPVARGGIASGRDDQAKLLGECLAAIAS